jgi:DNA polymerase-3 subunit alpha
MYLHLTTHSAYSLQEGLPLPAELAQAAAEDGMPAIGLTDHRLLTGAVEFVNACKAARVQPILGLEIDLESGPLALLAINSEGWSNLCRFSSALALQPDPESNSSLELLASYAKNLLAISGNQGDSTGAQLGQLKEIFSDRLYVALQDPLQALQLSTLAHQIALPTVATHPVFCLTPDQAVLQRTLSAIRLNQPLDRLPVQAVAPEGAYFVSAREMESRFAQFPAALAATGEIAARCKFDLPLGVAHMPTVPLPAGFTATETLRQKAEAGAHRLYGEISPQVRERLDHELTVIAHMGFEPIFLIVEEILDFARRNGVPFSSRGSAASSLVAHCLGITSPDPLKLDLYFERFLNPARTTPPDIDTDLVRRTTARMIVRNVSQVKKDTCEVIRLTEKGNLNGKIARRKRNELGNRLPASSFRDLMIWVRLNCLKSSDKLETCPPLTQRLRSSPDSNILHRSRCEILLLGTMVNETCQITKRHPKSPDNVIHDCTAGLPTGREPYGNGNSIVVGGVTST